MKVLSHDGNLCVGCYTCEEVCSETWFKETDSAKSSIRIQDDGRGPLSAVFCIQCGECLACVGFCPYSAMFYYEGQPEPFKCVACGKCADECPAGALEIIEERA